MRVRATVVLAAAVLLAGYTAATAAPPSPRAVPLAGDVTLKGSGLGSRTVVSLNSDVPLPGHAQCLLSEKTQFSGTAAQAGVFLTELPLRPESRTVWVVKVTLAGHHRQYDSECLSTAIPRGKYLLQLVHTSGTSQVRLTLPGLTGKRSVLMSNRDGSTARALRRVTPSAGSALTETASASWGAHGQLSGRGSVLTLGVVAGGITDRGADTQGDCLVSGAAGAVPDLVAFAPGCPLGGSGLTYGSSGIENWQATLTSNLAPGGYGAGYWFVGTPTHSPWGATSFWLENLGN